MALVQITENTLRAFLADAEIAAFDSAGAEGDSPERAGALIRTTCNLVAGIVNSSGKYPVLATGQDRVPEELEHPTLVWIRHAMLADLPDMGDLEGSPRAKQYSTAGEISGPFGRAGFILPPTIRKVTAQRFTEPDSPIKTGVNYERFTCKPEH
jgi:hypothetical protein